MKSPEPKSKNDRRLLVLCISSDWQESDVTPDRLLELQFISAHDILVDEVIVACLPLMFVAFVDIALAFVLMLLVLVDIALAFVLMLLVFVDIALAFVLMLLVFVDIALALVATLLAFVAIFVVAVCSSVLVRLVMVALVATRVVVLMVSAVKLPMLSLFCTFFPAKDEVPLIFFTILLCSENKM